MKRELLAVGAMALLAGAASAQISSRQASQFGVGVGTEGSATYQVDDGTSENGIGLTNGGNVAFMNQFQVFGGNNIITSIDVSWGTPDFPAGTGLSGGESFMVYVWEGLANGAHTLIHSQAATVDAAAIDSNGFQSVSIGNVAISGGDGANFFFGASINHAAGFFPVAIDQTASAGSSFIAASVTQGGFNAMNLANNDLAPATVDSLGLPGNFMLRANAIPTPGAVALFGVAGLAATRRRR